MTNELPSPDQILEELADKVALQIDRLTPVAFDGALREMAPASLLPVTRAQR
jgi:hypothetical protein